MKYNVLKPFLASPRSGSNVPKDFSVGDVLEAREVKGAMVAFRPKGSHEPIVYQLPKETFDESTERA